MAGSSMRLVVYYVDRRAKELVAPDLTFQEGFVIQEEYVDWYDPDEGVFWDRSGVWASDESVLEDGQEDYSPFRQVHQRVCVIEPEELSAIAAVMLNGSPILLRHESATSKCGLVAVDAEELIRPYFKEEAFLPIEGAIIEARKRIEREAEESQRSIYDKRGTDEGGGAVEAAATPPAGTDRGEAEQETWFDADVWESANL